MKKYRKIYVEITNICNMKCSFCPDTSREKAFMDEKSFEHVAKEIKMYTDYIYLHVKGEPLMHPNLSNILAICQREGLKVNLSTNATLLKEKSDILIGSKIRQLNISLHSFEQQDKIENLRKYIEDVVDVCNVLANKGVIIRYKLWNISDNNNMYTNKYITTYLSKIYNIDIENNVYNKDKKLKENIFISIKAPFNWPDINSEMKNTQGTCYGLRNQIAILVDGSVVPCCVDNNGDINLGNIFNSQLTNILNSKRAIDIKKGFENNKYIEQLCKKCEYRKHV